MLEYDLAYTKGERDIYKQTAEHWQKAFYDLLEENTKLAKEYGDLATELLKLKLEMEEKKWQMVG